MLETELKNYFGFDTFLPGQKEVISKIVQGQSGAAVFPTGAGKSICYQLPAMLLPHLTLVVSPLLSLMKDQLDFLWSKNIPAQRLDSSLAPDERQRVLEDARTGRLKILMISVERFKNERFRNQLRRMKISLMVVDEAHCISEWGHNFRPEYLKIPVFKSEFSIPQVLLLTATATPAVIQDMSEKLDVPMDNIVQTGSYRKNLHLSVVPQSLDRRDAYLLEQIQRAPDAPTIVYVTRQHTADDVARFLMDHNIPAQSYHAGLDTEKEKPSRTGSWPMRFPALWPPLLLVWAWTRGISGGCFTMICPAPWKATARRSAGPAGTGIPVSAR